MNKENISPEDIDHFKVPKLKEFLRLHNQSVGRSSNELKARAKGFLALSLPESNLA